jgi:hypothetical protein
MNILQIIGLCLMAPFLVCLLVLIIEKIKEDPINCLACVICIMAIAGVFLLLYGYLER